MEIQIEDIEVDLKLADDLNAEEKAVFTITIGPIEIKGFRISTSKFTDAQGEKLWIMEPSYRSRNGKWNKEFYCKDEKLWREIKEKILEEFYRQRRGQEIPIIEEDGQGAYGTEKRDESNPVRSLDDPL